MGPKGIVLGACLLGVLSQTAATRASTRSGSSGDAGAVRLWNQIATDAIVVTGANAPASSGVLMAIVQLAVYNAVVAIVGGYRRTERECGRHMERRWTRR